MKKKTRNLIQCKDDSEKNGTTLKEEVDKEKYNEYYHCVQCGKEMKYSTDVQDKKVPVCNRASCPNFGLLQLGIEIMSNFKEEL